MQFILKKETVPFDGGTIEFVSLIGPTYNVPIIEQDYILVQVSYYSTREEEGENGVHWIREELESLSKKVEIRNV